MVEIKSRGKVYEVPEILEELMPEQYIVFLTLCLTLCLDSLDSMEFKRKWLSYLIGMEDYTILLPEYIDELDSQLPLLDGFFTGDSLNLRTTRNLLPAYCGFKGPEDGLSGFPFGKFVECLTELTELDSYQTTEEYAEGLEHITRVMYDIPDTEAVPRILLFHAPRLFLSVWKMLQDAPVMINGEPIDFRILFKGSGSSRPDDKTGWTGITFEVAEKGLFGTVPEVEKTDMWAVLIYLYKCKFEYNHEISKAK